MRNVNQFLISALMLGLSQQSSRGSYNPPRERSEKKTKTRKKNKAARKMRKRQRSTR